jgi:hypothetical protein
MGTHVSVELDDYAREAYQDYVNASDAITREKERKDKARDVLVAFLRLNDVSEGDVNGAPVLRLVEFDRTSLDTGRLKAEEPFVYRRFARVGHVEQLRIVDGTT